MNRKVVQSIVLTSLGLLMAMPAPAEVAKVGPLHIRIATDAPPRAQREHRKVRPDRDAVWIKGYWDRQDDRWSWVPGRWERPSDRRTRWVDARYRREGRAWRYEPAHWSNERLVEGDDYRQWRENNRSDRDRRRDDQRARDERPSDRDRDRDRNRN